MGAAASIERLWPDGPLFEQRGGVFPLGTDSVLLADFASRIKARRVCDLGCGSGILPLLLCNAKPHLSFDAIEISEQACSLAEANFSRNSLSVNLVNGDLRRCCEYFEKSAYDLVISNPPYFRAESGAVSADSTLAAARSDLGCSVEELLDAAALLLKPAGKLALVFRPERLAELFCRMCERKIEPKRMRMVQNRPDKAPSLVLLEGRRFGNPGIRIEPPLILMDSKGGDSVELNRIYKLKH